MSGTHTTTDLLKHCTLLWPEMAMHPAKQKLSSHIDMGWIESYRSRATSGSEQPKTAFVDAARQRWQQLGEELKADVAEFSARHSGAEFSSSADNVYHVMYDESGLELDITADFEAQVVRYDYKPTSSSSAGAPEGGLLSMRQSRSGTVEFYSADERLTSEETRQVLLAPVLFPPQLAA
jgi:hypothetical protein